MAEEVIMPRLGEGVIEGLVSRWLKKEGDTVKEYEPILEIETDKVTTEAVAEVAGTLIKILVPEGETVEVGTVLAYIGKAGETVDSGQSVVGSKQPTENEKRVANGQQPAAISQRPTASGQRPIGRISPVVGRIASEHDVDLTLVAGTGRDGRITKKDILAYIDTRESAPVVAPVAPAPVTPAPKAPQPVAKPAPAMPVQPVAMPGEVQPLSNMRRSIAEHMVRSKHTSPHVTTVFEVDFSRVFAHRKVNKAQFAKDGAKLTYTAYIVSAIAQALKKHRMVNSSWTDGGILLKREINVGMAAAIDDGLIVPVIKGADGLNLLGLARVVNDLTNRARAGQLRPGDVQGGTFTLTNHGTSGSLFATPIINQPQCGILGVGKIEKRVVVIDDMIAIRPMSYVSLTFDHRILDGASADGFVSTVKEIIENWQ